MRKLNSRKHLYFQCVIFAFLIYVTGTYADGGRQFGLTGGTKGIGFKYSNFGSLLGVDIGVPIYYKYDKRIGDTIEFNHNLILDPYFTFSAKVYKTIKYEIAAGLSIFAFADYKSKNAHDTVSEKSGLVFDQAEPVNKNETHFVRLNSQFLKPVL